MAATLIADSIAQALFAEFETQAPVTRRFLERLPKDKLSWKPHERSLTAGQLALHIAGVPGGIIRFVLNNPAQAPDFTRAFPEPATRDEILSKFEETIAAVREVLPSLNDSAMNETFHLMAGERELLAVPRQLFLRDIMFSHWYQHRGQFCVYLRLLNVSVPASWGPSADEAPPFLPKG